MKLIKHCLNNENGGPHLDAIIALTVGFIITSGIWAVGRMIWFLYYDTPKAPVIDRVGEGAQSVIVGTQ